VAALCFNVKGPDLCFLDQPGNIGDADRALYEKCDVPIGPFENVQYFAPFKSDGFTLNTLRSNDALLHNVSSLTWGLREVLQYAEVLLNKDDVDAKADALAALEACGAPVEKLQIETGGPAWYHPGRSGTIKMGPKVVLGYFGEFHPLTLEALDVSGALCGFEVYVDAMPDAKRKATRTKPALELSPFQVVRRDFAFVVDKTVEAGAIVKAATGADRKLVTGVNVFDIFEGASLGEGKKSIAIEVSIQPVEKTLTDQDFEALAARIVENVKKQTGGALRS
jgi:phenylalanyl-tRNA synthetase beta subunit